MIEDVKRTTVQALRRHGDHEARAAQHLGGWRVCASLLRGLDLVGFLPETVVARCRWDGHANAIIMAIEAGAIAISK